MKILITIPSLKLIGGISNHYKSLFPHWKGRITYCTFGKRKNVPAILTLIPDWLVFFFKLVFTWPNVVLINVSLLKYPLARQAVNIIVSKLFRRKVVVFIHGWNDNVYESISQKPNTFINTYGKCDAFCVLYTGIRDKLRALGIDKPIFMTSTVVDNELLNEYNPNVAGQPLRNILFMARADKAKGLDITLEAYKLLKQKYPDLSLSVCGTGDALEDAKRFVTDNSLDNVVFHGFISGIDKAKEFAEGQIYILPTTHGEGMATSVLEAMAMGCVVITRPVGGVVDFFEQGKMGYLTESVNPEDYSEIIERLIDDTKLAKQIMEYNHNYATNHFMANAVTAKVEEYITEIAKS